MIVYIDILLAVNWWVDYLLLLAVRRFLGLGSRAWRLVVGSLVGGLFGLAFLLPPMAVWLSFLLKLAAAGLMVLVAFGRLDRRRYIKALVWLFGLSAGLSGLCSALYHFATPQDLFVANGIVYYAVSPWLLLALTLLCYAILWVFEWVARRRAPCGREYMVQIWCGKRSVSVCCLYDSGNHLVEPFSNRPVLVVQRGALEGLTELPHHVDNIPPNGQWRVVPYDTLGGEGLLPAFSPDRIVAITKSAQRDLGACYVAVCERLGRGDYEGLIGSALGDRLTEEGA